MVPFIGMIELARALWPALAGLPVDPARAWGAILLIVGALVLSFASAGASGLVSHLADNDVQLDLRGRIVRHLRTRPVGWFDGRSTGAIKKAVDNDVNAIHQLIAHAIQDVITAVTVPVITLAYLFIVEWRMALFALSRSCSQPSCSRDDEPWCRRAARANTSSPSNGAERRDDRIRARYRRREIVRPRGPQPPAIH